MCGIVGWLGPRAPGYLLETVHEAGRAQRHRGPDDAALLVLAPGHGTMYVERNDRRTDLASHDPDLGFSVVVAHQRLAILDPGPAGAQPMATRDQSVWLTYNGEIYNHVELRAELQRLGHRFAGHSDTEVLLAAYCEWGLGCLPRLAGMFAFALLDRRRGCVVLARDHLGQKPLFTRAVDGGLAFASEIAPLLRVGAVSVRAALGPSLDYLVTGRTDHRPDTMIEGVQRVDPGTAVVVTGGESAGVVVHRYWAVPEESVQDELGVTLDESARQLRELFDHSVRWHLRSDVPVGSLLSGGLDSSAIVLAQRRVGGPALDLSAVSYIGGRGTVSEEPWIDMVTAAARCRTEKLRIYESVWDEAEVAALHQGEPIAGPAILVHRALCHRASELGIKVLLDGQGADELLAGYPAALSVRTAGLLRQGRVPSAIRLMVASVATRPRRVAALGQLTARALRVTAGPAASIGRWPWIGLDRSVVKEALTDPLLPRTLGGAVRRYLTGTLPAILRWEDRNSMEASVEGRLPFLLPEVVEYCLRLPEEHLVGPAGQTKYVLREAVQDLVPVAVRDRRDKIGLAVPLRAWLHEIPDVDRRLERVQESHAVSGEWVRSRRSALRSRGHLSGRDVMVLWRLVGFDLWRDALGVSVSW